MDKNISLFTCTLSLEIYKLRIGSVIETRNVELFIFQKKSPPPPPLTLAQMYDKIRQDMIWCYERHFNGWLQC